MIRPPINASSNIGKYEIERAARYSAAMRVREIAKFVTQKAKPLARARTNTFFQRHFDPDTFLSVTRGLSLVEFIVFL